ncbi:MAG: hypothetical protein PHP26_05285 [Syntrophomonas sp.]|uniref:hypothetical protein n=1 Tax=Syntrophomonas sp. TaxID=2053627 RepID=UPI0026206422|nr:hypothetical protein [Syntrophomonas sp.]MDD2511041.1 hypothetical protein [Syntrophomonas sp.]MDD3879388.1 hypothetical protein [Syntrophomonas sp.]MDD4627085.1 hypothetical protein [Syntrophomonas sp.]
MEKVRGLYGDLLLLSKEQLLLARSITGEKDISQEMLLLFQKRQEIMEGIDLLFSEINRADNGDNAVCSNKNSRFTFPLSLGKQQAEVHNKVIQDIIVTIREIQAHDEVGRKIIKKSQQEVGKKLASFKKNQVASDAYLHVNSYSDGWFFDQKK